MKERVHRWVVTNGAVLVRSLERVIERASLIPDRSGCVEVNARWLGLLAVLVLAGCREEPRAGVDIPSPWPRPVFTLTGTDGGRVAFDDVTRGYPTLLLFGFASCPDICPAHMASIAGATRRLSATDRSRLRVVFITADPDRDTPDRLTSWLRGFDSTIVGLTGSPDELDQAAAAMLVPAPSRYTDTLGRVAVVHYERVLGISADDSVRVLIPSGVGVEGWFRELKRLVRIRSRRLVRITRGFS